MKKYIDEDIVAKTLLAKSVYTNDGYSLYVIMYYAETTGEYDFLLPAKDYIRLVNDAYARSPNNIIRCAISGRTKDDMPYFSIAGITFTMITEEEADKFRILK
jgi:hypothetical protein